MIRTTFHGIALGDSAGGDVTLAPGNGDSGPTSRLKGNTMATKGESSDSDSMPDFKLSGDYTEGEAEVMLMLSLQRTVEQLKADLDNTVGPARGSIRSTLEVRRDLLWDYERYCHAEYGLEAEQLIEYDPDADGDDNE